MGSEGLRSGGLESGSWDRLPKGTIYYDVARTGFK